MIFEFNVTDFKEDLDALARLKNDLFAPPILYREEDRPLVNKRSIFGFRRGEIYSSRAFSDLAKKFEKTPILDLTLGLSKNKNEKLYFERDGHFNSRGSGFVAGIIYEYLLHNKLLLE